jgi:hypothetical protein
MKQTIHKNSYYAHKRNQAKGTIGFILGSIKNLDMGALYSDEVTAIQAINKIATKLKRAWRKEIPKEV